MNHTNFAIRTVSLLIILVALGQYQKQMHASCRSMRWRHTMPLSSLR